MSWSESPSLTDKVLLLEGKKVSLARNAYFFLVFSSDRRISVGQFCLGRKQRIVSQVSGSMQCKQDSVEGKDSVFSTTFLQGCELEGTSRLNPYDTLLFSLPPNISLDRALSDSDLSFVLRFAQISVAHSTGLTFKWPVNSIRPESLNLCLSKIYETAKKSQQSFSSANFAPWH